MIQQIKLEIKKYLEKYYLEKYQTAINIIVEEPKKAELGDISIPMFSVVKTLHKPLPEITSEVKEALINNFKVIDSINVMGAFVNIMINKIM